MVLIEIPEKYKNYLPKNFANLLRVSITEAIENNHRRLIVISGKNFEELLAYSVLSFAKNLYNFKNKINCLYVCEEHDQESVKRYKKFEKAIKSENLPYLNIVQDFYKNSTKHMGRTYNCLILDMYKSLTPDDIGKLIGTVEGGGLIFILVEDYETFENIKTTFHEHLLTPPYTLEDVRNYFEKRFKRKIEEHKGIYIYDMKKGILKEPQIKNDFDVIFPERKRIIIPENIKFSERIYRVCVTQDQVEVLKILEKILYQRLGLKAFVIMADRGRGKSAILGLSIAALVEILSKKKKTMDIGITAPLFTNVQTLFEFLEIGLKKLGFEYKKPKKEKIIMDRIYIEYREPLTILKKKYDYLFVDEAAGISVKLLYEYLKKYNKLVFSSTIHGYEGAGRSFSVRFLKHLKENTKFDIYEYKMKDPIRYNNNDPIENWLFDTLLLDAEPAEIDYNDLELIENKNTKFYKVPLDVWFEKDEDKLRQFVGIYILAHYQNKPNDVAMLADAPHHDAYALELESEKIVTSIQVAYEGKIPEETIKRMLKDYKPKGNIIPDVIAKHYRRIDFPKLRGIRIVRIATHPQLQGKGLGSIALQDLSDFAKKNRFNWIGSSFGATVQLTNFWLKNGFVIVHVSPEKNRVSGEYSVIVVKPLDTITEKIVNEINYEFRWKFLNSITDVFYDISPELTLTILKTPYEFEPHFKPLLTETEIERAKAYISGPMTYEAAADIVRNLVLYYFMYTKKDKPKLTEFEELLLLSKVILAWSFKKIKKYYRIKISEARRTVKRATKKIYKWLYKNS